MESSEWRMIAGGGSAELPHVQPTVRLGEILPLLAAVSGRKASWLADLADDESIVSTDLVQVLYRYRRMIEEKSA